MIIFFTVPYFSVVTFETLSDDYSKVRLTGLCPRDTNEWSLFVGCLSMVFPLWKLKWLWSRTRHLCSYVCSLSHVWCAVSPQTAAAERAFVQRCSPLSEPPVQPCLRLYQQQACPGHRRVVVHHRTGAGVICGSLSRSCVKSKRAALCV